MTVALVLAGEPDAGLCDQLAALGVRRVDSADRTGPALLSVAAAARAAGERVLICVGEDAVPDEVLARLLSEGATAAFTGLNPHPRGQADLVGGVLLVDTPDLDALAQGAEVLAATYQGTAPAGALISELTRRGVRVRVLDAGPHSEGAIAQLIVDPAARDMSTWAAGRQLTPAALYGISLGLGLIAAIWFSELAVRAKLLAVVALAGSFVVGRAGSLLAATGRDGRVRPAVSWLGAASGLLTEFGIYAALAVSAAVASVPHSSIPVGLDGTFGYALRNTFVASWGGTGQVGVWRLAVAAMVVVGVRQLAELGYEYTARAPGNLFPRSVKRTLEQAATFPAGERFVVIAITAVLFGPRLTFLVLLGWGVLAAGYVLAGQLARSAISTGPASAAGVSERTGASERAGASGQAGDGGLAPDSGLTGYRGDGVVSRWIGGLVQGRLFRRCRRCWWDCS